MTATPASEVEARDAPTWAGDAVDAVDFDAWFDTPWGRLAFAVASAALLHAAGDLAGNRVLDAGCGTGRFSAALDDQHSAVVGVDPDPKELGDLVGDGPGEHRAAERASGAEGGVGGVLVVGVAGDATIVEDEERSGVDGAGGAGDVVGEPCGGLGGKVAVEVVEKLDVGDAEDGAGGGELVGADGGELTGDAVEGGGFAVGEAEHADATAGVGEGGEDGAEAEGFVAGVGAYDEHAGHRRQAVVHECRSLSIARTWKAPQVGAARPAISSRAPSRDRPGKAPGA
jgi:SAM-dependent methyltransferase